MPRRKQLSLACLAVKRKLFAADHPEALLTQRNLVALQEAHAVTVTEE